MMNGNGDNGAGGDDLEQDAAASGSGAGEPRAGNGPGPLPAIVVPVVPDEKWEFIPDALRKTERSVDMEDLQKRLDDPNYLDPPISVKIVRARSFALPFYVSRAAIRDVRLKAGKAVEARADGGTVAELQKTLTSLRREIDSHPSRKRLRLIQIAYTSSNGAGTMPADECRVSWLIADCGEDGDEKPERLFPLDYTNLPLFRILEDTEAQMRFHPRGASLTGQDKDWHAARRDVLAYLEFHFLAVRGSGGRFEMISDREEILKRYDPKNSMKRERKDLKKILNEIRPRNLEAQYFEPVWEPMVQETPLEHVSAETDSDPAEHDSWRQPLANSIHHCTAHLLFSNRIYRADISLTEIAGVVDLQTLQIQAADLPIRVERNLPYDRIEFKTDKDGAIPYRPKGWADACHVSAEHFVLAAEKGNLGLEALYYLQHRKEKDPEEFRREHGSIGRVLRDPDFEKNFELPEDCAWMRDKERRAFYVTEPVRAPGRDFAELISVRAYFEDHVILESTEFQNSLDLSRCVFRRSLNLSNCSIQGALELNGTRIEAATAYRRGKPRLNLDHTKIEGPLLARGLQVGRGTLVSIRKSRDVAHPAEDKDVSHTEAVAVRPISARSVEIQGEVDLRGIKIGALDFDSAKIRGNFRLSSESFDDSSQDPGTLRRGAESSEERFERTARGEERSMKADWRKADALASVNVVRLDFADIDGDVSLCGLHGLYLFMRGTKARGNIYLRPAYFPDFAANNGEDGRQARILTHILRCIDMDFAEVRGIVHAEGLRTGLNLRVNEIEKTLKKGSYRDWRRLDRVLLAKRLPPADLNMSFIEASAVKLSCSHLGGTEYIRTQINGAVIMQGIDTKGPVEFDGAWIAGKLDLSLSKIGGMVSAKFVQSYICRIFGDLNLTNTQVSGAAEFYGLWVGRSLRMPDAGFEEFFMRSAFIRRRSDSRDFVLHNPYIGHQFNADNVKIRGTLNLTGIQIGFGPAFQGERRDGDRDENRDRLNMRYAEIKGPLLFWQAATIRTVARGLSGEGAGDDETSPAWNAACTLVRTRIFGDVKVNHASIGAGLCLINTLVTGRAIFSDASVGGDINTEWPSSLKRPNEGDELGDFRSSDHEWRTALHDAVEDLLPPRRNYLEIEDKPGFFQCCQLNLELLQCRGDGFFCDSKVFDLENPRELDHPDFLFEGKNALSNPLDYAPDFLARGARFHGRMEFAPWRNEAEKLTAKGSEGLSANGPGECEETFVAGKLDLSFAQASFAVLDAQSFQSTMLDYKYVVDRLRKLHRGDSAVKRRLENKDKEELADFLRGAGRKRMEYTPAHLKGRLDHLLPIVDNGRIRGKSLDLPPVQVSQIRRLDLDAFGVDLERASIAHLEFLPSYEEPDRRRRRREHEVTQTIGGRKKTVEFPRSVNLHGLDVKRWDIQPEYFKPLLDAQPGYEQSTYTMIQRELQDQGHVVDAMKIYYEMRLRQGKFKSRAGQFVDWLERACFRYFTRPMTPGLALVLSIWLAVSTFFVFSNPRNVMPSPDSIDDMNEWRSTAADVMQDGNLEDWDIGDSFLVSVHYHFPFLSLRPGEKWQASDAEPVCSNIHIGKLRTGLCTARWFTAESYATLTALVHWLIYPFVIIAMSATVVRNRTAGQGRND